MQNSTARNARWLSLVLRSRALTEALQSLQFRWRHRGGGPVVVVHQMARVGSLSVFRAVRRAVPAADLYHTHYLNASTIAFFRARFDRMFEVTGRAGLHREFLGARFLARRIERGVAGRWRIVSLVRDPVARSISAFFKHFPYAFPELGTRFLEEPANVPALMDLFLRESEFEHGFTLGWFEQEMEPVFGIDVYSTPFQHAAGHVTLAGPFADLLLLRLEDLDRAGPSALGTFFGTPPVRLRIANRAEETNYSETYRRFREAFEPPAAFLDRMYESRLARHFYRPEERARLRAGWEQR